MTTYTLDEHMALEALGYQYQPADDNYKLIKPDNTYLVYKMRKEDTRNHIVIDLYTFWTVPNKPETSDYMVATSFPELLEYCKEVTC